MTFSLIRKAPIWRIGLLKPYDTKTEADLHHDHTGLAAIGLVLENLNLIGSEFIREIAINS